ncbi:unnamed protein product [Plasmodium vivax]|uniref:(malaria parasite P. vivax) hypothetical protein n=1 Tax=Plasmodium vivax TaxID=5855 RepID=A0A8S4HJQ3_PLAVI|nr:unnamed protein product [Plasmodium vivax]
MDGQIGPMDEEQFLEMDLSDKFVKLKNEYDFLENLYLYKFYEKFNDESNIEEYEDECRSIETTLQNSNGCRYLKFWFNDQIISNRYDYSSISPILETWDMIKHNKDAHSNCDNDGILNYYYDEMVKGDNSDGFYLMEIIYEYLNSPTSVSTDHDTQDLNVTRREIKGSFITEKYNIYKEIRDRCLVGNSSSLLCKIYNKCKTDHGLELAKLESTISAHIEAEKVEEKNAAERAKTSMMNAYNTSGSSSGSTIMTTTVLTVAVTLSFLFILYKFTPLGIWINSKRGRKKEVRNMFDYEMDQSSEYSADPRKNWGRRLYNIRYNFMGNN